MQTKEWRFQDKSEWGPGPWQDEPDKKQWTDPETGLPCLIVRNGRGALCGYVGLPEGHPDFEVDQDERDKNYDVHGGVTFSGGFCDDENAEHGICHLVEPGEPDRVWWIGFDCSHYRDMSPRSDRKWPYLAPGDVYRTLDYVQAECARLAQQVAAKQEAKA